MRTIGETLKIQRNKVELTVEEVSRKTRIQEKYILFIENNDFKRLPTATFVKGFIQNYAKAVGFDPKIALAIFRRDFSQDKQGRIIPRSLISPIENKYTITPRTASMAIFSVIGLAIVIIFIRQIVLFYQGPEIKVEIPTENQQVISPLEIKGQTVNTQELLINNQKIELGKAGEFATQIQLTPGDHSITFVVNSRDGKSKILQRHITVTR